MGGLRLRVCSIEKEGREENERQGIWSARGRKDEGRKERDDSGVGSIEMSPSEESGQLSIRQCSGERRGRDRRRQMRSLR